MEKFNRDPLYEGDASGVVVMVFGTFDTLHKGHESFFKQAKNLGDYLIVVVARDTHVKRAKRSAPVNNERMRARNVRKSKLPDKVILGSKIHNFYRTIRTYKPKIIALGYDQKPAINELKRQLRRHRLSKIKIIRLRAHRPKVYKTSLILNKY